MTEEFTKTAIENELPCVSLAQMIQRTNSKRHCRLLLPKYDCARSLTKSSEQESCSPYAML